MHRLLSDEVRRAQAETPRGSAFIIDDGNTKEMPDGLLPWSLRCPCMWPASWPSP